VKINDIIKEAPPRAIPAQAAALKQRRQAMPQNTTVQATAQQQPQATAQQQPQATAQQQPQATAQQQPQATASYNVGNKLGQMAGKVVSGVKQAAGAVATPVLVAKQIAKQAAPGIAHALKSQTGGSDPMGLGGFQPVSSTPTTNPSVAVMDPTTKKPVTYTKYGQDWMDSNGNGVIDPAMISHLEQQLKANRARASGE